MREILELKQTKATVDRSTILLLHVYNNQLFANIPIDAMARIMDVANNMGDGKSIGYDVVAGVTVTVLPPSFSVVAGNDDDDDDIVPADTAFTSTFPSSFFAKRCEDGSGGNPNPSLFIDVSLPFVSSSLS
jgi:hypothetical protein